MNVEMPKVDTADDIQQGEVSPYRDADMVVSLL